MRRERLVLAVGRLGLAAFLCVSTLFPTCSEAADIYDKDWNRIGHTRENPDRTIDIFDTHWNRIGWGRREKDGMIEFFDTHGNRIGQTRIEKDGAMEVRGFQSYTCRDNSRKADQIMCPL